MRASLRDVLTAFRVQNIVFMSDGGRAWNELRNFQADLANVDWNMRPLSGPQSVRRARTGKDSQNQFLPVIMLTAYSERRRVMRGRDAGVTVFLVKPETLKRLYDRIAAIIETNRGFIRSKTYFGPDRRRSDKGIPGKNRRNQSLLTVVDFERSRTEAC